MTRLHRLERPLREDLFINSKSEDHLNNKVRKVAVGHYEIKWQAATHRLNDWLTAWQENNDS